MSSRGLGGIERLFLCRNIHGLYSNFAVTAHYNHELTKVLLSNALQILIEKYPVFAQYACKVGDMDDVAQKYKNYILKSVDSIDYDNIVIFRNESFNERSLEFINTLVFPPNNGEPTWKLVVFKDDYLSFVNDHLLMDGQSGRNFHSELVHILNGLDQQNLEIKSELQPLEFKQQLYRAKEIKIKPSPHELSIYHYSYWGVAKFLGKEKIPRTITNYYNYYFRDNYPNLNETPLYKSNHKKQVTTFFKLINIPSTELQSLIKVLKSKGVSLTSFLIVYINYCFQKSIVPELSTMPLPMKCCVPVSGRNFYTGKDPEFKEDLKFKFVVSAANVTIEPVLDLDERAFELMKTAKKSIQNDSVSEKTYTIVGFAELANPYKMLSVNEPCTADTFFEVSNIGNVDIKHGDWKIDDLVFSQCIGAGNIFGFSVASTPENGLNVVFTHLEEYKHVSSQEFVNVFKRELKIFIRAT